MLFSYEYYENYFIVFILAFFFMNIILILSCSRMFRNVQCYGFYRRPTFSPLLRFLNFDIIAPLQEHVK